jgi:hypothetical protein
LELIGRNSLTSWWDLTTNLNIYTSKINADSIQTDPAIYSWFAKINAIFKLSRNFTLQITGTILQRWSCLPAVLLLPVLVVEEAGQLAGTPRAIPG